MSFATVSSPVSLTPAINSRRFLCYRRLIIAGGVRGLECVGHSFAYVAHFVFLRDVWIRTQRLAVASRCATNLATHLLPITGVDTGDNS
jgi:hypothetical protein